MPTPEHYELLDTEAVARLLLVSVQTLANWRAYKIGPPFIRLGNGPAGPVRYRKADIYRYLDEHAHATDTHGQRSASA